MRDYSNTNKRLSAVILAIAIVFTAVNPALWLGISAGADGTATLTDAAIIADNYDLTDAEKNLLKSGYLIGEEYTYSVPTDGDDLVKVDTDSKTITAKTFSELGYTWVPTEATLTYGNETEVVTLIDGKGTYTCESSAFSVDVSYVLKFDISEETQQTLLSAAPALKQGVANLDAVADADADLLTILTTEGMMDKLVELANGMNVAGITLTFNTSAAKNAANALDAQRKNNESKNFNLNDKAEAYKAASSKVEYLVKNGAAMHTDLSTTYAQISAVRNDSIWGTITTILSQVPTPENQQTLIAVNTLLSSMDAWLTKVKAAAEDPWTAAHVTYVAAGADFAALDILVSAIKNTTTVATIKNPLVVAVAKVRVNMSMFNVTIAVALNVFNEATGSIVNFDTVGDVIVLHDGATEDDITAAVNAKGVEAKALAKWAATYVDGKFDRTVSVKTDADGDVDYVITYTPKTFKVTYAFEQTTVVSLPYGAKVTLPKHSDPNLSYDYKVNGVSYAQNSVVTVDDDLQVTRTFGKSYTNGDLMSIVSDHYFTTDKPAAILTSGALFGNVAINYRAVEASDGLVTLEGNNLTAEPFDSSYAGLKWLPYSYNVLVGTTTTECLFGGATTVTLPEYDHIDVVYRLALGEAVEDAKVLELLNLPNTLAIEAGKQVGVLNSLLSINGDLGQIKKITLTGLGAAAAETKLHDDPAKNAELQAFFVDIVNRIKLDCFEGDNFKIHNTLNSYKAEGLVYYYKNAAKVKGELNELSEYLTEMLDTPEKQAALAILASSAGYAEYAGKISQLNVKMAEYNADLNLPNAAIDLSSPNLDALVEALLMEGTTAPYATLPSELYLEATTFSKDAEKFITVTYSVQVAGKKPVTVSFTFNKEYVLTAKDRADILNAIETLKASLGINEAYYTTDYNASLFNDIVGKQAEVLADIDSTYVWSPKTANIIINDKDTGVDISVNSLTITLPAHASAAYRYDYKINGKTVPAGKYTFTEAELAAALATGSVKIERVEIFVAEENLVNFVNKLNASVDGSAIQFALVENNGKFTVVMKVNATQTGALTGAAKDTAMALIASGYSYIGLGGHGVLANEQVSIQALIDAVMESGIGTQTVIDIMDANGNIKNTTVSGKVISNTKIGAWGGKLLATTMQLGSSSNDALDVDFLVTLGSAPAQLTKVRNLLAGQLKNYFNVVCEDGKVVTNLTMPQKAYEAYLAVLLATDNINLSDIDAVNGKVAIGFVKDLVDPLFTGNVTTTTLTNTLSKFGYKLNLTGYEDIFSMFCNKYSELDIVYDGNSATATAHLNIASILDKLNVPGLSGMVVEYSTGIEITASAVLNNIGTDYEALYLDVKANGLTNKAGLTTNLKNKLANVAGASVIVLLDDVKGDLTFNATTVLNLNGFTVDGNVIAKGNVIIVDSSLSNNGGVTGKISGNATVIAGKYSSDVSAFLKAGYLQKADGVVGNKFFDLAKDEDGNITLELDAGVLATESMPNVKALALDVVLDLLFNGYSTNMLSVEGNEIYSLTYSDFVGLYTGADRLDKAVKALAGMLDSPAVANVINMLIEDVTDFGALKNAIENGEALVSYKLQTGAWKPVVEHVVDGDYITVGIATGNVKETTFKVVVTGSDADKAVLAGMMGVLDETVDADAKVELNHGFVDKNLVLDWSASGSLVVDLSNPKHAVLISVVVADGIGAPANADLVAAIKTYYETNNTYALKKAFNNLTVAQLIAAVNNLGKDDEFVDMLAALGLTDVVAEEVVEIESYFDSVAKIFAAVVRRLPVEGGTRTLGSFLDPDGTYGFLRTNVTKTFARDLVKGYSITLTAEVESIYVSIKLFGEGEEVKVPEFVDGTGTPIIGASDKIAGFYIDTTNKYIYIDVNVLDLRNNGITVEELKTILTFSTINADSVNVVIGDNNGDSLVCNGAKLVATASNSQTTVVDTVEYTIIVIGDVNCNGRTDTGDATWIAEYYVGLRELDDAQKRAADIGRNGRIDIGDASLVATKYVTDWKEYKSSWITE